MAECAGSHLPFCRPCRALFLIILTGIALLVHIPVATADMHILDMPVLNETRAEGLLIICRDMTTNAEIAGVQIFIDGEYRDVTTGTDSHRVISPIAPGEHSIRVVKRGYLENITMVRGFQEQTITVWMHPAKIVPIGRTGPVEERIDIVFVPSSTQYDCTKQQKINTDYYTANEDNFRKDVDTLLQKKFLVLDTLTSDKADLPADYLSRFNFYYYSDPGDYADAFKGCAGTLPDDFWEDAPFTDTAIIVYPIYKGIYTGPPCEPNGCASTMGPGVQAWMKCPANSLSVCIHEAGHVVFGLIDTYCGETYYSQNDPNPNVWSSLSACTLAATENHWDPSLCRQITQQGNGSTASCSKKFWRYDPEPDLMGHSLSYGKFGSASTSHMRYLMNNINRWKV